MLGLRPVLFLLLLAGAQSYRILVLFPTPSHSHQIPQQAISRKLAERGHEVVIVSPSTFKTDNKNITQIDGGFIKKPWMESLTPSKGLTSQQFMDKLVQHTPRIMEMFLTMPELDAVWASKFDAVLIESLGFPPLHAFGVRENIPIIGLATMLQPPIMHQAMGNPTHPVLHPSSFLTASENPGIFERLKLIILDQLIKRWSVNEYVGAMEGLTRKLFPEVTMSGASLIGQLDLLLEQVSPVMGFTRPLLPNTKQIGFLHVQEKPQPLPKDLDDFCTKTRDKGFIYMSLGSNVQSSELEGGLLDVFIDVFRQLEIDVLWKFETENLPNKPANIKLIKWAPQQDLFAHCNISVFVTQGGQQSLEEAVYYGIPTLIIPFFSDQEFNAQQALLNGMAVRVKKQDLTRDSFEGALNEMLRNPKYSDTVKEMSRMSRDTVQTPTEEAAWWIEYTIRNFGAKHMRYKGEKVPFYEFYFLDIAALLLTSLIFSLWAIRKCFKSLFRKAPGSKRKTQ